MKTVKFEFSGVSWVEATKNGNRKFCKFLWKMCLIGTNFVNFWEQNKMFWNANLKQIKTGLNLNKCYLFSSCVALNSGMRYFQVSHTENSS